jgi:CubicO group peptidase (beta-lactamase class C family)
MNCKFSFKYFILFLILCGVVPAYADQVDDFVRAQMRERHIPGVSVVVVKNGRVVKTSGYGLANVELNVPATKDTVFEIGSVTKQMTAAAIMLLVEEGKIDLDASIGTYLSTAPKIWSKVTVRNLLTHTSGVKSYTAIGSGFELSKRMKRDEFVKAIGAYPLDFEPGSNYNYSNSGYNLLGFIIETVSGKSYWDFMRERIFQPLGMNQTANRDPQFIVPNRADGYEWENGKLVGRDYDLTDVFSAGAIVSTAPDLAKWDAALRGETLLKKTSINQMWTPFILSDGKSNPYGFGFNVAEFRGHRLISHGGQTAGFAANISRYVTDDLTVIVLTNLGDQGLGGVIARGVAKIYLPEISMRALKANPTGDAKITNFLESALRARMESNMNLDSYTDEMRKTLSGERAKILTGRLASFGKLKNFVFISSETAGKTSVYRYKAETSARIMLWRFELDESGKINGMILEEEE